METKNIFVVLLFGAISLVGCSDRVPFFSTLFHEPIVKTITFHLADYLLPNEFEPVDILWVIDNSGSMAPYQQKVRDNTSLFIDQFISIPNLDWKMGLISTDTADVPYVGFTVSTQLNHSSTDPAGIFRAAVARLGTAGSGIEKMYTPVTQALSNPFIRPNAFLALMVVSDTEEQSSVTTSSFVNSLLALKGSLSRVLSYLVLGPTNLGCTATDMTWSYEGSRYQQFQMATNGKFYLLCSPNFSSNLLSFTDDLITKSATTKLPFTPGGTPTIISVSRNHVLLPQGEHSNGGVWTYDALNGFIILTNASAYSGGDEIEVEYTLSVAP